MLGSSAEDRRVWECSAGDHSVEESSVRDHSVRVPLAEDYRLGVLVWGSSCLGSSAGNH